MITIEVQQPIYENGEQVGWHDWRHFLSEDSLEFAQQTLSELQRDNPECNFRIV